MTDHHLTPSSPERLPADGSPPPVREYFPEPAWPAVDEEGGGFDWRVPVSAILRYKWIVVLAALLGVGGAYFAGTMVEPEYTAEGSLWIQSEAGDRGPIATDGLFRASSSWVDIMRSYAVLDPVAIEQKLYVRPALPRDLALFEEFTLDERFVQGRYLLRVSEDGQRITLYRDGTEVDRGVPGDMLGTEVGLIWPTPTQGLEPAREIKFSVTSPRVAATRLRDELVTELDRQGTFIRVELRGREQDRVADIVNAVMTRHVALAAELKSGNLAEQTNILEEQLRRVENDLANSERVLEEFRIATITLPSEGSGAVQPGIEMTRGPVFNQFFQMRIEQEQIRRDRERIEGVLQTLPDSGFQVESIEQIPSVRASSELQDALSSLVSVRSERRALLQIYTPDHPPAQELAERIRTIEGERIPSLLFQLARQLRDDEELLERRIASSGTDLSEIPTRAIEEARLRRQVAIDEELYTELRRRFETASLASASSIPEIRILDEATTPEFPGNAQGFTLAVMVFLGFVGGGLAAAVFLGKLDPRLRTPDEIPKAVGLHLLGAIPRIRRANGKRGQKNVDQVYEAFRELRTNLSYAYGAAGPLVVTISSPGMEEGKTFISTNLGVAFASLGRRTLIVDADTRRGDLHHYLGGERKPGLTDYLRSAVNSHELIQQTPYDGLQFIGSGTQVANSPELLSSERMTRLFGELKTKFDVIIVDSPPLGAGADALVLSSLTGNMMVVIRSGSTHKDFTQAKLEPLFRLPIRLLGVALNDYEPELLSSQYQRYYGSYIRGYEAGAEEDPSLDSGTDPRKAIAGAAADK